MKYTFSFLWIFFFVQQVAIAQLIYTDPVFPKADSEVTVYFDATQGTGGLAGCNCDVYVHTGVITENSSSPSDWKYVKTTWGVANNEWKMTPVAEEEDLYTYTITPSVRSYYGVPANELIEKLAFVFRNSNGTKEGKGAGNSDIFYTIYPDDLPFASILLAPDTETFAIQTGEIIKVHLAVSDESTITLFENDNQLLQTNGLSLQTEIEVNIPGEHFVEITADNGTETLTSSFTYTAIGENVQEALPEGVEDGITLLGDTSVLLVLHAPQKEFVFVLGNWNDWQIDLDYQMKQTPDGNKFWLQIDGLQAGNDYLFQYFVDGKLRIADPYSTLVMDPWNDPYIPEVTFPDLPQYPEEKTTGIISWVPTDTTDYQWNTLEYERPDKDRLVIYELLIRDFIHRHDYETLIDSLDYLQGLGINAIELMPVNEFEGNISWGYNPSFHMALDKYYGTINAFKSFVDSCHTRGIAVILDVVYNHAFGQSPFVQLYPPEGNNNPWINAQATHPYNVGYDFNHESADTKRFVKKVMRYWLDEFKIDGFRFDLSKGFTQTFNPDNVGAWGNYDASRITILKDYANVVWETTPGAYVILEHFASNIEEKELANYGMLLWGNMNHNYNQCSMGYESQSDLNWAFYANRGWSNPHLITYMESHDEERLMYKNLQYGNGSSQDYSIKHLQTALRRQELVSTFFYTLPGPKMLWQFGELGYDINIDYNGRTGEKPIRWQYFEDIDRRRLYDISASLIHLRNTYPVFHTSDYDFDINAGKTKSIHLNDPEMDVCIIGNFDVNSQPINPKFQHTGIWYDYFSGDSTSVSNVNELINLEPGEYLIYTSEKLPEPAFGYLEVVGYKDLFISDFQLYVFPNPSSGNLFIKYELEEKSDVQMDIYTVLGQKVMTLIDREQLPGIQTFNSIIPLPNGQYFIKLRVNDNIQTKRISILK
ncbi:MAG: T9SS type A sorting domain-containing protein [Bacteroidetes bacterium]|nr:T9SS type A sorting domain-containing protein [Bacteroidota bacterium]